MCSTCGCSDDAAVRVTLPHEHPHEHPHGHDHPHEHRTITLEQDILAKNDTLAAANRTHLQAHSIAAVNLMSSPGSGKTTLLERTIKDIEGQRELGVVEGDQETLLDADRIQAAGGRAVQVNTGAGCHLDAHMLDQAIAKLDLPDGALLFIENVGNLVCPALFDLGEQARVTIISVTEGADKPAKYPYMFRTTDLVILNKIDLLPYVDFDVDACERMINQLNPQARMIKLSATKGDGIDAWYDWLAEL